MAPFKQHLDKMAAAFAAIPDEIDLKERAFPAGFTDAVCAKLGN